MTAPAVFTQPLPEALEAPRDADDLTTHAGRMAALDRLLPWRTVSVPTPDECESCGHIPDTCGDLCC
jgi:hypothetical protein